MTEFEQLQKLANSFFDWPTEDRTQVTTTSAILFAQHILAAAPQQAAEPVAWISIVQCVGPDYGKERYGKLPVQSLQPGYYRHVPLYAGQPPAQPEQRFQQIGFTRIDRIGRPSAMIISDTKYRAASDAGVYVPVFVGEGDTQAPAVGDAVQQSCAECGPVDDGTALYCVRCVERMGLPAPMPETIKQH
jgi:hypothetical protein